MRDIVIPELSESVRSGTVVKISVKPGDQVTKGQTLLELETEKAVLEVPSPSDGVIAEILTRNGDKVEVGQAVFRLSAGDEPSKTSTTQLPVSSPVETPSPNPRPNPVLAPSTAAPNASPAPEAPPMPPSLPRSRGLDASAAPSIRRFAREIGVNIEDVAVSDTSGRMSIDDVKAHARKLLSPRPAVQNAATESASRPLPDFSKWGEVTTEPMSNIRQKTAEHLAYVWTAVPHVTHCVRADIAALDRFRRQVSTDELKLTITPFVIKVLASALKLFPKFNASIDMTKNEIVFKKYVNIGCAVDTEHGLLVPVIRHADQKSILAIARELKDLSDKARSRKLSLEEMQGGTFTITSLGGILGGTFTPIIHAPEVAILGISRAEPESGAHQNANDPPRLMLPLCLSYDHRLIDGADGARFLKWICEAIEQPFLLELR